MGGRIDFVESETRRENQCARRQHTMHAAAHADRLRAEPRAKVAAVCCYDKSKVYMGVDDRRYARLEKGLFLVLNVGF